MATVRVTAIPPGNAGVLETARRMADYIRAPHPGVDAQAQQIALELGSASRWARAAAVYKWVQDHLVYVHDGEAPDAVPWESGQEGLRSPDYLLRGIANAGVDYGDCDDYVILMGALLYALGIPVAIVLTSGTPSQEYDHVFLRVQTESGPVYADAITGQPFGWHVPADRVTLWTEIPV